MIKNIRSSTSTTTSTTTSSSSQEKGRSACARGNRRRCRRRRSGGEGEGEVGGRWQTGVESGRESEGVLGWRGAVVLWNCREDARRSRRTSAAGEQTLTYAGVCWRMLTYAREVAANECGRVSCGTSRTPHMCPHICYICVLMYAIYVWAY
jgi:hypothetical protein